MKRFSILGELIAVDGKRDALVDILLDAEQMVLSKDMGCYQYAVNISEAHPNSVFVYEQWLDEASHQNSLKDEAVFSLIMKAKPLLRDMKRHFTFVATSN